MKSKYLYPEELDKSMCKALLKRTCKDKRSNFMYYELVDDFGDTIKKYPWYTEKNTIDRLKSTCRLIQVRVKYKEVETEDCLM